MMMFLLWCLFGLICEGIFCFVVYCMNNDLKFYFGGMKKVMRLFNSFQIVAGFVAIPFGIAWLQDQTFMGQVPAFYASVVLYILAFFAMIASVYSSLGKFKD